MNTEKLISRMKALLAMSRDASSGNEAAIAMKRLHSMLAKHNISMTELDGDEDSAKMGENGFTVRSQPWRRQVAFSIAKLYFCRMYYVKLGRNVDITVVGTEVNREFAMGIIQMVLSTVDREARAKSKAFPTGPQRSGFITSFRHGAKGRISARCNQLIEDAKQGNLQDEEGSTMPVLASVYDQHDALTEDFCSSKNLEKTTPRPVNITSADGYRSGTEAGNRVQLTRSLHKQNTQKQLGA